MQKGVTMNISRCLASIPLYVSCAVVITCSTPVIAAESSCVTCHLDEDMLTDNLKVVKAKASAMQSGAG